MKSTKYSLVASQKNCQYESFVRGTQQQNLLLLYLHLLVGRMVISKEDALFITRPKPKVNVQLPQISLFSKSSWIKTTTASGQSYELGVNGEKKVNEN